MQIRIELLMVALASWSVRCEYSQPVNDNGESVFDLSSLKFVSVIARHGSRSPLGTFPTDLYPYTDLRYWPEGVGRLTKTGKNQAFEIGEKLKSRYKGFISDYYNDNETIFLSNAMDRDLASSQLMAAGMYPPTTENEIWKANMTWQPIAVWSTDYDVGDTESYCQKFKADREQVTNDLYETISPRYENLFSRLANYTGLERSNVWSNLYTIWQIPLLREENGLPNITWQDEALRNELFYPVAKKYQTEVVGTSAMKTLMSGPVIESLLVQLVNKTEKTLDPDRKLFTLAAHDTTIVAVVGGLGIDELLIPDTASSLVFELHNSTEGDIVQILYFNRSSTVVPTRFEMPQCPHPCPLKTFIQVAGGDVENSGRDKCIVDRASSAYYSSSGESLTLYSFFYLTFATSFVILTVI